MTHALLEPSLSPCEYELDEFEPVPGMMIFGRAHIEIDCCGDWYVYGVTTGYDRNTAYFDKESAISIIVENELRRNWSENVVSRCADAAREG